MKRNICFNQRLLLFLRERTKQRQTVLRMKRNICFNQKKINQKIVKIASKALLRILINFKSTEIKKKETKNLRFAERVTAPHQNWKTKI